MLHLSFVCVLILLTAEVSLSKKEINDFPIIGIFTQPTSSKEGNCDGDCLYLAASYVKYIEAAGARVVPINYYADTQELDRIFSSVNGILFPGGGAAYPSSAQYMYDKVVESNDKGDFMPLWGTCMGFQWLLIAASKNESILDPSDGTQMDAYNYSIPLNLSPNAKKSKLFSEASDEVIEILSNENVTLNNHHYGIYTDHFYATPSLQSFYSVLSTNNDRKGAEFISTMEAFNYPIYGSQWHPEKNDFEWGMTDGIPNEAINHTYHAVIISQYTANYFVEQSRKNLHAFNSWDSEDSALIENYPASKTTGSFMQTYFFDNKFQSVKL